MLVRNVVPLLCIFLHAGFCRNPARILVQGIGTGGTDFSFSASELALLQQRTITATDRGKPVTFQGVLPTDVLAKVATPTGDLSRYGHHICNWALFEPFKINPKGAARLDLADPDLQEALAIHHLQLGTRSAG
jgi:hypothetical protein